MNANGKENVNIPERCKWLIVDKMNYTKELITALRAQLQHPLPGWDAQKQMATETHRAARLHPPTSARQAGVLILLYPGNQQKLYFPLIQRPTYDGAHSGQIAFPGGKVEPHDQDIIDTALRETEEEIGVTVSRSQVLGQLTDLYIPVSRMLVSPVVAYLGKPPHYIPDPFEVAATLDVSASQFLQPQNQLIQNITVRGFTLNAPSYLIQNQVIWGATAMILAEFFAVMQEIS